MPKYMEPCFFYIYKVFWSFLHDFNLLNPNPLSARRKSLSNFVQMQKTKMAAKMRSRSNIRLYARIQPVHIDVGRRE